jgi:WhiB family redox-sensing transcriptional regulator
MTRADRSFLAGEEASEASTPGTDRGQRERDRPDLGARRPTRTEPRTPVPEAMAWKTRAGCQGRGRVFFAPPGERPDARRIREVIARSICATCPVMSPCRGWARTNREYEFWGGESEEERAAAGFRVEMASGRVAHYPRGEGQPVQPRQRTGRSVLENSRPQLT